MRGFGFPKSPKFGIGVDPRGHKAAEDDGSVVSGDDLGLPLAALLVAREVCPELDDVTLLFCGFGFRFLRVWG